MIPAVMKQHYTRGSNLFLSLFLCLSCLGPNPFFPAAVAAQELKQLSTSDQLPSDFMVADYAFILKNHVDENGLVDYSALQANRVRLDKYVQSLNMFDPKKLAASSEQNQIAFWLNAYNALTLVAIIDHYPIKSSFTASLLYPKNSIRQIAGVWNKLKFKVLRREVTLDDIEHKILRVQFHEPRLHMALVCASIGCPFLRAEPYTGKQLDAQLDDQTRRFLSDGRNLTINRTQNKVAISSIFDWFKADFTEKYGRGQLPGHNQAQSATLHFIAEYLTQQKRNFILNSKYALSYLDYDWTLNEQRR